MLERIARTRRHVRDLWRDHPYAMWPALVAWLVGIAIACASFSSIGGLGAFVLGACAAATYAPCAVALGRTGGGVQATYCLGIVFPWVWLVVVLFLGICAPAVSSILWGALLACTLGRWAIAVGVVCAAAAAGGQYLDHEVLHAERATLGLPMAAISWHVVHGPALVIVTGARYAKTNSVTHCNNCGYSLAGLTSNTCPECGSTVPSRRAPA